ncbi:glycosyltransferase family 2 protein [Paenibacillus sp. S150]|uniref:glycosyltransferase family 2 protein n=1 Tax=Paenibacillus sp. S150 TaxID=2749826 RepID=UPI001C597E0A|nr:glycosyltransferase family 2 protein [Paenibacillus sp. S150]MBW4081587.1 glycosyltransferase family 2 protein [Paenibacillus sp. S150]
MNKPRVLVLLSTYNGKDYLEEQLDSLLSQDEVQIEILIRDDGSADSTLDIIQRYQSRYRGSISLYRGENLGAKGSFFELIKYAFEKGIDYDYFSFCDQDDVWKKNKLFQAISLMNEKGYDNKEEPLMYCSVTQMVDNDLAPLATWPKVPRKPLTMYNAMVENVAVGCTTVINRSTLDLIANHLPLNQDHVIMHDWWMYLCVSVFGKVVFDKDPYILYRQHSANVLGGENGSLKARLKNKYQNYTAGKNLYIRKNQISEFISCFYSKLNSDNIRIIETLLEKLERHWIHRIMYTRSFPFYRQSFVDNIILKLTYVTGKI